MKEGTDISDLIRFNEADTNHAILQYGCFDGGQVCAKDWKIGGEWKLPEFTLDIGTDSKCIVSVQLKPRKVKGKQYARPFIWSELVNLGECTISTEENDGEFKSSFTGFHKPLLDDGYFG